MAGSEHNIFYDEHEYIYIYIYMFYAVLPTIRTDTMVSIIDTDNSV